MSNSITYTVENGEGTFAATDISIQPGSTIPPVYPIITLTSSPRLIETYYDVGFIVTEYVDGVPVGTANVVGTDLISGEMVGDQETVTVLVRIGGLQVKGRFDPYPCFAAGTRLGTPSGAIAVEELSAGDIVDTTSGPATICWIGCRRAHDARVVHIRPDALGAAQPHSDLYVSDDHAMLVDGVLVPAGLLVNGETILVEHRATVVFYHVELDHHAILLAEGAPAESYLDTGNRAQFGNCPLSYDPVEAYRADACAELVLAGARLEHARATLPIRV